MEKTGWREFCKNTLKYSIFFSSYSPPYYTRIQLFMGLYMEYDHHSTLSSFLISCVVSLQVSQHWKYLVERAEVTRLLTRLSIKLKRNNPIIKMRSFSPPCRCHVGWSPQNISEDSKQNSFVAFSWTTRAKWDKLVPYSSAGAIQVSGSPEIPERFEKDIIHALSKAIIFAVAKS